MIYVALALLGAVCARLPFPWDFVTATAVVLSLHFAYARRRS
jgi:hypothetical protein